MDEYRWNYHVPAFGSWDYYENNTNLDYTQCFENARHVNNVESLFRYGTYNSQVEDKDLYVAGDLYQNDVVTPTLIVVPRQTCRVRKGGYQNVKVGKKQEKEMEKQEWRGFSYNSYDVEEPPSPILSPTKPPLPMSKTNKSIDQDLYQISPQYFHVKPKRKRGFSLFSSCLS